MPTGNFKPQSFILGEICAFVETEIHFTFILIEGGGTASKMKEREGRKTNLKHLFWRVFTQLPFNP